MSESGYVPNPAEQTSYEELPGGDLGSGGSSGTGGAGTGGIGFLQVFENRAPAAPDEPTEAAISVLDGGGGQTWLPSLQAWQ